MFKLLCPSKIHNIDLFDKLSVKIERQILRMKHEFVYFFFFFFIIRVFNKSTSLNASIYAPLVLQTVTFIMCFVNNADCLFQDAQLDLIRRYPHETWRHLQFQDVVTRNWLWIPFNWVCFYLWCLDLWFMHSSQAIMWLTGPLTSVLNSTWHFAWHSLSLVSGNRLDKN